MKCQKRDIVTIDGPRGVGKSRLGAGLRLLFNCEVLELGPLFRLLAWLMKRGWATDLETAGDVLVHHLNGRVKVFTDTSGTFAANRIEVDGIVIEEELWAPNLDELVKRVAESDLAVQIVSQIGHVLIGSRRAIVIGRETGRNFFPEAGLKVLLVAHHSLRRQRKVEQLNRHMNGSVSSSSVERSEPSRSWEHAEDILRIDTTRLEPEQVLVLVSEEIITHLGWNVTADIPEPIYR